MLALVLGKLFFEPALKMMLRIELIAQVTRDVKLLGERLADIPADVVHSGGPCLVQPRLKPFRASAKLARPVGNEQVFQISGTLVALVLVAQCSEVGHGNEFPCRARFVSMK